MRGWLSLCAWVVLSAAPAYADSITELQILAEAFSRKGVTNRTAALTGSALVHYAQRPLVGEYLPEGAKSEFRLLVESEVAAIYEATVQIAGRKETWSAFFQRDGLGSKLEALKSLTIPPFVADVELPKLMARKGRTPLEEARLHRLTLLYMSSAELKEYFNNNRATIEEIARLVETGKADEAKAAISRAGLSGALIFGEAKSEGELALLASPSSGKGGAAAQKVGSEIRLSGFLDGVVGLLHLPAGLAPPPISAQDYIFVEALAEDWYLFRNVSATPPLDKTATHG